MTLSTTGELVARAQAAGEGVLAFNVISLEHALGIVAGAERAGRAAILQISQNAVRFHGRLRPVAAATRAAAEDAAVPLALHLDHVDRTDLLHRTAEDGLSSVMFDAGALDYAANVEATRDAARWAHDAGLWVEAELGYVGGKPGAPQSAHAPGVRTDPDEAARFVADTGVDALAVAVGSSHAMTSRTAQLDQDLIARLRDAVPVPLVLHGSSGVPDDELLDAVRHGIVKINVGTALNVAFTGAVREALDDRADPRPYLAAARDAVAGEVERLLVLLGGR